MNDFLILFCYEFVGAKILTNIKWDKIELKVHIARNLNWTVKSKIEIRRLEVLNFLQKKDNVIKNKFSLSTVRGV